MAIRLSKPTGPKTDSKCDATIRPYGPDVSDQLVREALYPYDGILITTDPDEQMFGAL
jgi:hypothetical protein